MDTIERIIKMEAIFDELLAHANQINTNPLLKEKYEQLLAYYSSPLWLSDYELDSQNKLPSDLKRGVLSQDGVYNLILDCIKDK